MSITIPDDEKLYPVASIFIAIANVDPADHTVSRLIRTGELAAVKVLGKWHCRLKDVHAYIERSTNRSAEREKNKTPKTQKTRSEAARAKAIAAATAELEAAGL